MSAAHKKLFDGADVSTTPASEWVPLIQFEEASVHLIGLAAGDTVDIEVSNETSPTAAGAVTDQQVSDADALVSLSDIDANWFRLNVTADGANGSTLDAHFAGYRRDT